MASVAATAAVTQWQALSVAFSRRGAGVAYPKMYADGDDEVSRKFNCAQRAHQNTLETLPNMLALQMLLGLLHPQTAAAAGFMWAFGRVVYTLGYSTGDPAKRAPGFAISSLAYLALMITTAVVGVRTATGI